MTRNPPKKPAAPPLGLPWETQEGSVLVWDSAGQLVAQCASDNASVLQRKRAARIAQFIVEAANATIKEPK